MAIRPSEITTRLDRITAFPAVLPFTSSSNVTRSTTVARIVALRDRPSGGVTMDTDWNLLFGVLALQADLIDNDQFVKASTLWTAQKELPLSDILVDQGWMTVGDRADVD